MKQALAALAVVALVLLLSLGRGRPPLSASPIPFEPIAGLPVLDAPVPGPGRGAAPPGVVSYVDPETRAHPDDINQVSARLVEELLAALGPEEEPLVFAARELKNPIDLDPGLARLVWSKLRAALLRSGRVRLASAGPQRAELQALKRRIEDSGLYARRPAQKKAEPAAPRYLLRGRLSLGAQTAEKPEDQTFTLTLSLDTIETAETLWSGEAAILESLIR